MPWSKAAAATALAGPAASRTPLAEATAFTPDTAPLPAFMSIADWCRFSGLSRTTNYRLVTLGHVPTIRVGRMRLIDVAGGLAYLRTLAVPAGIASRPPRGGIRGQLPPASTRSNPVAA
jgi:hypothetical protein